MKVQDVYFEMIEISKFLGTILGTMGTIEVCKDFAKNSIFRLFHEHVDGTQVVPRISKSKNMMFKLSNALSDVLIRLLEPDSEKVEISQISKFSFVGQNFQKLESADIGRKIICRVYF